MMKDDRAGHSGLTERPILSEIKDEFKAEVIFRHFFRVRRADTARKAAITTSALSTFEEPVYAARNDGICLDLRQILADEVAQSMTGRHFQKKLTA
jgi:hypothetical protein